MPREKMTTEEQEMFCILLEAAMEGRSYMEYAKASGVSASNISRIKRSEYRPHPDILKKLTSPEAKPANNVTYQMLRQAVGYEKEGAWDVPINTEYDLVSQKIKDNFTKLGPVYSPVRDYETECLGILCTPLFKAGISFGSVTNRKEIGWQYLNPDIVMYLPEKGKKGMFWVIENMSLRPNRLSNVEHYLCSCIMEAANPRIKVSVVVSEPNLYKQIIKKYKDKLAYRGDLSVILLDFSEYKVVEEVYLAHYYEEERKQKKTEFYIVEPMIENFNIIKTD